ncbi:hypothetical protein B0H14DRAFT_3531975 [Mycena olivaceomarginata]|nr:hypothetical protein B0H14DRAFT_3531975 [Mycena olivaceomarginata]
MRLPPTLLPPLALAHAPPACQCTSRPLVRLPPALPARPCTIPLYSRTYTSFATAFICAAARPPACEHACTPASTEMPYN